MAWKSLNPASSYEAAPLKEDGGKSLEIRCQLLKDQYHDTTKALANANRHVPYTHVELDSLEEIIISAEVLARLLPSPSQDNKHELHSILFFARKSYIEGVLSGADRGDRTCSVYQMALDNLELMHALGVTDGSMVLLISKLAQSVGDSWLQSQLLASCATSFSPLFSSCLKISANPGPPTEHWSFKTLHLIREPRPSLSEDEGRNNYVKFNELSAAVARLFQQQSTVTALDVHRALDQVRCALVPLSTLESGRAVVSGAERAVVSDAERAVVSEAERATRSSKSAPSQHGDHGANSGRAEQKQLIADCVAALSKLLMPYCEPTVNCAASEGNEIRGLQSDIRNIDQSPHAEDLGSDCIAELAASQTKGLDDHLQLLFAIPNAEAALSCCPCAVAVHILTISSMAVQICAVGGQFSGDYPISFEHIAECVLCCWRAIQCSSVQPVQRTDGELVLTAECALNGLRLTIGISSPHSTQTTAVQALLDSVQELSSGTISDSSMDHLLCTRQWWIAVHLASLDITLADSWLDTLAKSVPTMAMTSEIHLRHLNADWNLINSSTIQAVTKEISFLHDPHFNLNLESDKLYKVVQTAVVTLADAEDWSAELSLSLPPLQTAGLLLRGPAIDQFISTFCDIAVSFMDFLQLPLMRRASQGIGRFAIGLAHLGGLCDQAALSEGNFQRLVSALVKVCCELDKVGFQMDALVVFDSMASRFPLGRLPHLLEPLLHHFIGKILECNDDSAGMVTIVGRMCGLHLVSSTAITCATANCIINRCLDQLRCGGQLADLSCILIEFVDLFVELPVEQRLSLFIEVHDVLSTAQQHTHDSAKFLCRKVSGFLFGVSLLPNRGQQQATLQVLGELLFILFRCPLCVIPSWPCAPEVLIEEIIDAETAALLCQFCSLCNAAELFSRQALRDLYLWLNKLPALQDLSDFKESLRCVSAYLLGGDDDGDSVEAVPVVSQLLAISHAGNSSVNLPTKCVFGEMLTLGLRKGGTLMDSAEFKLLLRQFPVFTILGDELIELSAYQTADTALKDICYNPQSMLSWGAIFKTALSAVDLLSDALHDMVLYPQTYPFLQRVSGQLNLPVNGCLARWPLHADFLQLAVLPWVEAMYSTLHCDAWTSQFQHWRKCSLVTPSFLQRRNASMQSKSNDNRKKSILPISCDNEEVYIQYILVLHRLKVVFTRIVARSFQVLHRHRLLVDEGRRFGIYAQMAISLKLSCKDMPSDCQSAQKERLRRQCFRIYQLDDFWNQNPFALVMSARLCFQLKLPWQDCMNFCNRALALAQSDSKQNVLSKSERVFIIYHVSSLRLKIGLKLLVDQTFSNLCVELENQCEVFVRMSADIGNGNDSSTRQQGTWAVLHCAVSGLEDCRRRDGYFHQAVHCLAKFAKMLKEHCVLPCLLPSGQRLVFHTDLADASAEIPTVGGGDLFDFARVDHFHALQILHKLFDKKRPQIVAIWMMENPVSLWDQVAARTAEFDCLRRKYILLYVQLLEICSNLDHAIQLASCIADCKYCSATSMLALDLTVRAVVRICYKIAAADPESRAEMRWTGSMERIHQLQLLLRRKHISFLACLVDQFIKEHENNAIFWRPALRAQAEGPSLQVSGAKRVSSSNIADSHLAKRVVVFDDEAAATSFPSTTWL